MEKPKKRSILYGYDKINNDAFRNDGYNQAISEYEAWLPTRETLEGIIMYFVNEYSGSILIKKLAQAISKRLGR